MHRCQKLTTQPTPRPSRKSSVHDARFMQSSDPKSHSCDIHLGELTESSFCLVTGPGFSYSLFPVRKPPPPRQSNRPVKIIHRVSIIGCLHAQEPAGIPPISEVADHIHPSHLSANHGTIRIHPLPDKP